MSSYTQNTMYLPNKLKNVNLESCCVMTGTGDLLIISENYSTDKFADEVQACLQGGHDNSFPFPHFSLEKFVDVNPKFLNQLRDELNRIGWSQKSTDLYDVYQTRDLEFFTDNEHFPALSAFRSFMAYKVRDWLQKVTGVKLTDKVSMNGSKYCHTNTLLPHDDRLEGRMFAFIYYLSPSWKSGYGGRLHLYGTGEQSKSATVDFNHNRNAKNCSIDIEQSPTFIAKSIVPAENTFLFFRVQANSWHSVEEVIDECRERISINGWFYSDDVVLSPPSDHGQEEDERDVPFPEYSEDEQLFWINKKYLLSKNIESIQSVFTQQMEISLPNFLQNGKYASLLAELNAMNDSFKKVGTLEIRNFYKLDVDSISSTSQLSRLLRFLRSESFFTLLSQWTSVPLSRHVVTDKDKGSDSPAAKRAKQTEVDQSEEQTASSSRETSDGDDDGVSFKWSLLRFSQGCYTVLNDASISEAEDSGYSVEVFLFFQDESEWPEELGGFTSFYAKGETEETLRIPPAANTLAIVFRQPDISSFVKYINSLAKARNFYVFRASIFHSKSESEDESDSDN